MVPEGHNGGVVAESFSLPVDDPCQSRAVVTAQEMEDLEGSGGPYSRGAAAGAMGRSSRWC